ncbi:hypothetical protein DOY81_012478, partial [Sarcophaga bullata]
IFFEKYVLRKVAIMASPTLESVYLGQDSLQTQYISLSTTTSALDLIDSVKSYQHQQYERRSQQWSR